MAESKEAKKEYQYIGRGHFKPTISMSEHLLKIIIENGPLTRQELKEETGIPWTTLFDALIRLVLDGKVRKSSEDRKMRGRPKIYYEATESED